MNRKVNKNQIYAFLLILFFVVLAAFSLRARASYRAQGLPIGAAWPWRGQITFDYKKRGELAKFQGEGNYDYQVVMILGPEEFLGRPIWRIGDGCMVRKLDDSKSVQAEIASLSQTGEGIEFTLALLGKPNFQLGEEVEIHLFAEIGGGKALILPRATVFQREYGPTLYQIVKQAGPWGEDLVLEESMASVVYANAEKVLISRIRGEDPVAYKLAEFENFLASEGMRVKVVEESFIDSRVKKSFTEESSTGGNSEANPN